MKGFVTINVLRFTFLGKLMVFPFNLIIIISTIIAAFLYTTVFLELYVTVAVCKLMDNGIRYTSAMYVVITGTLFSHNLHKR